MTIRTFTIAAAAAAIVVSAAPARAQVFGSWGRAGAYRTDIARAAHDNGYRAGFDRGAKAARDRKPFDIEREKDYRKADAGYRRDYGNRDYYRDEFRRGFADGYRQGYARDRRDRDDRGGWYPNRGPAYPDARDRYPRGGGTYGGGIYGRNTYGADIAFRNGQADGYEKGLDDARHGRAPQPERQKWYRSGDRHYEGRDGLARDEYKNIYRRGFQEGYARAYQGWRR
jgi:hypothetical protein